LLFQQRRHDILFQQIIEISRKGATFVARRLGGEKMASLCREFGKFEQQITAMLD